MSEHQPSLADRLKRLAGRGTPRGAANVFAAAEADANAELVAPDRGIRALAKPVAMRRATVATAIAASVALVAGVAAALTVDSGDKSPPPDKRHASATTSTSAAAATTSTTVSEATKVYLASTRLIPFDNCAAVSSYAKRAALKVVGPYGLPGGAVMGDVATDNAAATAGPTTAQRSSAESDQPKAAATGSADYSGTNVQEAGIDEPDSVKTDGKTIFAVTNGKVFATAAGANPELIGSIAVEGAAELLRIADKLIVISPGHGVYASRASGDRMAASSMPYGGGPTTSRFTVVDISNPRAMKETGHLDVDGNYVSARTVDGVARLVVRSNPNLVMSYPQDGTPEAQAAAKQKNIDAIQAASVDAWLPHITATDDRGRVQSSKAVACASSYHPPAFSGFGMLSVLSFNTENPSYTRSASVMANGEIVYASPTRVYIATNEWGGVSADGMTVTPTAATLIHAFDITDPVQAVYRASGRVRGTVLNQFAMSEHKAALRVATTDPFGGSESFMTVLGDSGKALVQIGQVGGLGKGERIYAVRYVAERGYVVTFRQVDPLYVLDLSEPTNPRVVGELKITGYSGYLHPLPGGRLLGVGQEATPEGRVSGFSVSIFDVRDPAKPSLAARHVISSPDGGSSSAAEFDHHAFLYWEKTSLAVMPLRIYDWSRDSAEKQQPFNGAVGLTIGDAQITEAGRVQPPNSAYGGGIERSVVIGDRLYMTTHYGVLQARLDNLQQTAWVAYPVDQPRAQPEKPQP